MKPFYEQDGVRLYQADVLFWALDYKAQIDAGEALCFLKPSRFCVSDTMTGMTKSDQIIKLIGREIIVVKPAIGLGMMNCQRLTKLFKTFFLGHSALLADALVSLAGFAFLCLPIRSVAVSRRTIDVLRVLFSGSVLIPTGACTIFARPLASLEIRCTSDKNSTASLTSQLYCIFGGTRLDSGILTLRGTMPAPTVIKTRAFNFKYFIAKFTDSIYKTSCMYSAFSRTMNFIIEQGQDGTITYFTVYHQGLQNTKPVWPIRAVA